MTNLLEVQQIEVVYDQAILAVRDISINVTEGSIVALLGANGAGKSTTLKTISRLVQSERGSLTRGQIRYQNQDITNTDAATLVKRGLVQVLEGRRCFPHLTVEENLRSGTFVNNPSRSDIREGIEKIYQYFPRLKERRDTQAGYTSGGEQQMIAIGRALMTKPELILLDEPSMGLAPKIVEEIFAIVHTLNQQQGISFLIAEQNARLVLQYADFAYLVENGEVRHSGQAATLNQQDHLQAAYLGGSRSSEKALV
ncbi:ABC transporter ATP-binding protein [Aquirhabdus parva]|nr:ABC transporter ATP-binding protein [Aquirhabdus parva]